LAINRHYDNVQWVEIGFNSGASSIEIDNVVSWADRVVSPDGDMVDPMLYINNLTYTGVHHNHKYWEMDMVLDTNYEIAAPVASVPQYWQTNLQVQTADAGSRAIKCGITAENDYIEWLKVYVRQSDGTQACITYANAVGEIVWCIGETSSFNNEIGTRHQTTTFKFICLAERTTATTTETHSAAGAEAPVKYMRIDQFVIPGATAITHVLRFEDDYVMNMTPQFMPNTFQGLDLKQDQKWRRLTLVVDSEGGAMDPYVDIITANTVLPINFYVDFTLADGAGTVERWTYNPSVANAYVISRRDGRIDDDVARDTLEYQIIAPCNKSLERDP